MQSISNVLAAGGVILLAASLSAFTLAQDYVDLEAERAAVAQAGPDDPYAPRGTQADPDDASAPGGTQAAPDDPYALQVTQASPDDPYAPRGTQAYPATSYGVGTAPAGAAVTPGAVNTGVPPVGQAVAQSGQGQNLGALFIQIQQLQQQVMQLNGRLEEQANELRILREQSLQRYVDLDKRITAGAAAGGSADAGTTTASAGSGQSGAAPPAAPIIPGTAPTTAQPGEAEAYRAAYALVQGQRFDEAVQAFKQFQRNYPAGKYSPNAYYWLGELYLVVQPQDLESSRQSFAMLLSQYPDNSKAPDALYKLGKVQFMKGNREKAREYLDLVISRYGSTNSSAVKLSRDFIAENY